MHSPSAPTSAIRKLRSSGQDCGRMISPASGRCSKPHDLTERANISSRCDRIRRDHVRPGSERRMTARVAPAPAPHLSIRADEAHRPAATSRCTARSPHRWAIGPFWMTGRRARFPANFDPETAASPRRATLDDLFGASSRLPSPEGGRNFKRGAGNFGGGVAAAPHPPFCCSPCSPEIRPKLKGEVTQETARALSVITSACR